MNPISAGTWAVAHPGNTQDVAVTQYESKDLPAQWIRALSAIKLIINQNLARLKAEENGGTACSNAWWLPQQRWR